MSGADRMRAIMARGRAAAEARAAARRQAMAVAVESRLPGVSVGVEGEALVPGGRGLAADDAWLRNPGRWT
jgi:hypothetical protein